MIIRICRYNYLIHDVETQCLVSNTDEQKLSVTLKSTPKESTPSMASLQSNPNLFNGGIRLIDLITNMINRDFENIDAKHRVCTGRFR